MAFDKQTGADDNDGDGDDDGADGDGTGDGDGEGTLYTTFTIYHQSFS